MKRMKTTIGILAVVFTVATAGVVFAQGGYGYGGHMMGYGGYGMGPGMMGYGGNGYGMGPGMMGYGGYGGYGMGPGMMGYGGNGYGMGPGMMGYGPWANRGYAPNLSEDQIAKLNAAREHFFDETRDLRGKIQDKQIELRNEFNSDHPDEAKIARLQKDLSKLEGEFDQKSIQYQLEVRKLLPQGNFGNGYGRGYGNGGYGW